MIEFGGWEMPLQYSGIVDEHLAVRRAVGLFDVSHMGEIFVEGPTAHTFLDRLSANDVPTLAGKARYTHLLREDGTILDDVIVTCLAADRFLLVCNAGPRAAVWSWLTAHASAEVALADRTTERLCLGYAAALGVQLATLLVILPSIPSIADHAASVVFSGGQYDPTKIGRALDVPTSPVSLLGVVPALLFAGANYLAWSRINKGEIPPPLTPPGILSGIDAPSPPAPPIHPM